MSLKKNELLELLKETSSEIIANVVVFLRVSRYKLRRTFFKTVPVIMVRYIYVFFLFRPVIIVVLFSKRFLVNVNFFDTVLT